ncbi:hypothetical protein [Silicimonas sp. MF1-12-2]|uniref:hypothetical protein n=1 Tax=Silicimonas sp. MF1-12-2 TaxID=3384793 RepID=UPI0039B5DB3C
MTVTDHHSSAPDHRTPMQELLMPLRPLLDSSRETKIILAILAVLAFWGIAILAFGVPALVWPMKLIVPGLCFGLVALTWGM